MGDRFEDGRLGIVGVLFEEFFLVFLVLFGAFVLVQAFESFEGLAANLALPFRFGGHTDVGLLQHNTLLLEELLRDGLEVCDLTLCVIVVKLC